MSPKRRVSLDAPHDDSLGGRGMNDAKPGARTETR
jgi:hypothetical protein